jgi:EF hand
MSASDFEGRKALTQFGAGATNAGHSRRLSLEPSRRHCAPAVRRKIMRMLFTAVSLAALSLAGAAFAEEQGGPPPHGPGAMLSQFDANHDGVITRREFDAGRASMFTRMDANHDGVLTGDEMRPPWAGEGRGPHGPGGPGGPGGMEGPGGPEGHGWMGGRHHHMMMERADANHDGNISREEFLAGPNAMFDRLDANHDGVISAEEREAHHHGARGARFNPDADHDGRVTRAEFDAAGADMFGRLDANHDGRISREEAEAAHPFGPPRP